MSLERSMGKTSLLKVGTGVWGGACSGARQTKNKISRLAIKRQIFIPFVIPAEAGIQGALRLHA